MAFPFFIIFKENAFTHLKNTTVCCNKMVFFILLYKLNDLRRFYETRFLIQVFSSYLLKFLLPFGFLYIYLIFKIEV